MIQILSKRALAILKKGQGLSGSLAIDAVSHFQWNIEKLENSKSEDFLSDKILTLKYFFSSASDVEILFLETLATLCLDGTISKLVKLSFREVENYLRDENHLPVFGEFDVLKVETSFLAVKNSLLASLILKKLELIKGNVIPEKSWPELTFIDKNRTMKSLISELNNLVSPGKTLELILVEGDEVSLVQNEFPFSLSVIQVLLDLIFTGPKQISSLKVVAV